MPSFVYSSVTIEQLDDVDGYAPSVQPVGAARAPPVSVTQLHSRMIHKPTLIELIKQQQPPSQQRPVNHSTVVLSIPAHDVPVNAEVPLPSSLRQRLRWSPSPNLTRDSLALSFFVSLLLFCALCVDQFALTEVTLDVGSSQLSNPSNAATTNTLGAFTFCRAGAWTQTSDAQAASTSYTFKPDHYCSHIGIACEADGWSLSLMLGRSDAASCGLFDAFRAYLLLAFFCSVATVGSGVVYVRRPRLSAVFGVVVVFMMAAVTVTTLIASCIIQSILPSSATNSHSFWLVIAALLLSVPCSAVFAYSEYKRLYRSPATPPDAIHSDVLPVRLTEGDDELDERWERQRHEVSQSTYTLDDDHGALLAIEEAAHQPAAPTSAADDTEAPTHTTPAHDSTLRGRRKAVAFIASRARVGEERSPGVDSEGEDGEREVSVSRIDMQQAEWDEEADEARMEGVEAAVHRRTERTAGLCKEEKMTEYACI